MRSPKKSNKFYPFPVTGLKDTSWKVATDEITYLLQSHLQFPGFFNQLLGFKGCVDTHLISLKKYCHLNSLVFFPFLEN